MNKLVPLLFIASFACAPPFGAPCENDLDCTDGFVCSEARCVRSGPPVAPDAGPPVDAGPPGPTSFVGPGEVCGGSVGCEQGPCVSLGPRAGYSVCEPDEGALGCAGEQFPISWCTTDVTGPPPHPVDCTAFRCVSGPGVEGRDLPEGAACESDDACALRTCAFDATGATICRSDRGHMFSGRDINEDGRFTPACSAPLLLGGDESTCMFPCSDNADCPTGVTDDNYAICNRSTGVCEDPACDGASDCDTFEGSFCFQVICATERNDFPGEDCGGNETCADGRECWNLSQSFVDICDPFDVPPAGCGTGFSAVAFCDTPACRQACVSDAVCEDAGGLACDPGAGRVGDIVSDEDDCALPLFGERVIDSTTVCLEPCQIINRGTAGERRAFDCGEVISPAESSPPSCNFPDDSYCPLPSCDQTSDCAAGSCISQTSGFLAGDDVGPVEFCLDLGECREDAECTDRCSATLRQCGRSCVGDCACTGTVVEAGFAAIADPLGRPTEVSGAASVVMGERVLRFGGDDSTTLFDEPWVLNRDGAAWGKVFHILVEPWPGPRTRHALAVDPASERVFLHGGRDGVDRHADLQVFDFATLVFTEPTITNPPAGREDHSLVVVGNELILIGGELGPIGSPIISDGLHRLDFTATPLTWLNETLPGATDPGPVSRHAAIVTSTNHVLVMGGGAGDTAYRYDPTDSSWTTLTPVDPLLLRDRPALIREPGTTDTYLLLGGTDNLATPLASTARVVLTGDTIAVSAGPTLPRTSKDPTAFVHPRTGRVHLSDENGIIVLVPERICVE